MLLKMKLIIKILLTSFILISCKNNIKKEFYYPYHFEFSDTENYQLIDFKTFESFSKLIDSLEILKYHGKEAYFKIETDNTKYNILVSTTFGNGPPILLKFKNILSVSCDSILKRKKHHISYLKKILSKDLKNSGEYSQYSDSPEKHVVSLTCEIDELEYLILKVSNVFNEIQEESTDSLKLNIFLNKRMELFPKPPKI